MKNSNFFTVDVSKQYEYPEIIMKINKILLIALISTVFFMNSCKVDMESKPTNNKIQIDGNIEEWSGDLIIYQDEGVVAATSYDEEFLYIALSCRKTETIQAIIRSGLVVWINDAGRSKKNFGIQYPKAMGQGLGSPFSRINY